MKETLLMLSLLVSPSLTLSQGNSYCENIDDYYETSCGTSIYEPDKYTKVSNPPLGNPPTDERSSQPSSESFGMSNFPCPVSESNGHIPTSVHRLRPGDIKVIGALGDSLTAANGADASWIFAVLKEYRGLSWSIGGDERLEEVTTLPNMLKKYNSNLTGYSKGVGSVKRREKSRLNVAVPGSTSTKMVDQARQLIDRMKEFQGVDFINDWKMVTLFVGGNDLCDWVKRHKRIKPKKYKANIKEALDLFKDKMPRTFVNLVQAPDVIQLSEIRKLRCISYRMYLCLSVIASKKRLKDVLGEYRQELRSLVDDVSYYNSDSFTVVLQPMYEEIKLPRLERSSRVDVSYFAPDCFHFSRKGHEAAAKALWNNLENPYICTRKNGRACN